MTRPIKHFTAQSKSSNEIAFHTSRDRFCLHFGHVLNFLILRALITLIFQKLFTFCCLFNLSFWDKGTEIKGSSNLFGIHWWKNSHYRLYRKGDWSFRCILFHILLSKAELAKAYVIRLREIEMEHVTNFNQSEFIFSFSKTWQKQQKSENSKNHATLIKTDEDNSFILNYFKKCMKF